MTLLRITFKHYLLSRAEKVEAAWKRTQNNWKSEKKKHWWCTFGVFPPDVNSIIKIFPKLTHHLFLKLFFFSVPVFKISSYMDGLWYIGHSHHFEALFHCKLCIFFLFSCCRWRCVLFDVRTMFVVLVCSLELFQETSVKLKKKKIIKFYK